MRRTLVLLLLAFLPLQFSWAAVAAYCQHEVRSGAAHLGHHEHRHHGAESAQTDADSSAGSGTASEKAAGVIDLDCGQCHAQCAHLTALPNGLPFSPSASPPRAAPEAAHGAHAPTRPERPQWARLA